MAKLEKPCSNNTSVITLAKAFYEHMVGPVFSLSRRPLWIHSPKSKCSPRPFEPVLLLRSSRAPGPGPLHSPSPSSLLLWLHLSFQPTEPCGQQLWGHSWLVTSNSSVFSLPSSPISFHPLLSPVMLEKASTWLPCFLGSRGLIPGGSLLWTGSPFLLFIPWIPFHLPNRGSLNRSHCPKPSTFSLLPSFLATQHASDVTENSGATEHACTPSTSLFRPQRGPSSACFPQLKFLR